MRDVIDVQTIPRHLKDIPVITTSSKYNPTSSVPAKNLPLKMNSPKNSDHDGGDREGGGGVPSRAYGRDCSTWYGEFAKSCSPSL
jgi:hypothetical protein